MIKDIGIWMDLLEFVANLGIIVCMYLIMFTSEKLTGLAEVDDHILYYMAFAALHIIFVVKFVSQELIGDEPSWIA